MSETAPQRDPTRVKPYVEPFTKPAPAPKHNAIAWAPIAGPQNIPFTGTDYQAVRKALIGMWGKFPIRLSKDADSECMKAMMFAAGDGQHPFHILHQALMQYGEIEVRDL